MSRPPRLALWALRLSRHGGYRDEIEDDLRDLFERRATASGVAYARRRYWRDVLSFYRPHPRLRRTHASPIHQGAGTMAAFVFDLQHVLQSIRRRPGFFVVAALTLAIGFAAHFAAFGIVDRLLLSPPPYVASADRVFRMHIDRADVSGGRFTWFQTPYLAYQNLRQHARRIPRDGRVSHQPRERRDRRRRAHDRDGLRRRALLSAPRRIAAARPRVHR